MLSIKADLVESDSKETLLKAVFESWPRPAEQRNQFNEQKRVARFMIGDYRILFGLWSYTKFKQE